MDHSGFAWLRLIDGAMWKVGFGDSVETDWKFRDGSQPSLGRRSGVIFGKLCFATLHYPSWTLGVGAF